MIKNLIKDYSLLNEDEKNSLLNFVCYNENLDAKSYQIVKVLIENRADYLTILSGLFLTDYRKNENLLNEFSLPENVITMLNSIKKIEKINMVNEEISTENIKNLLISMANDIRVILIKLADVLVDAENVNALDKKQADYLHLLIKELYAPIASRLGLSIIKSKLQDLNIKYLHPKEYNKIKQNLNSLKTDREKEIEINISKLKDMLIKLNIKGEVYGRVKHISSIYNKLKDKNYTLSQIFDLMAIRVIVNTENECYEVLSNINSLYEPLDGRFKDYIARPKPNGYKSIHTTVVTENKDPLEIQIRTFEMQEFAEYGVAAHFLYKEKKSKTSVFDEKLIWVRKMLENTDFQSASDYLDELKTDLYANEIFLQTPLGKVLNLKENSTPLDFAYAIHTEVGNKCVGCKVNGKLVPLNTSLNNGDIVEIITNPNAKPSRDWLKIMVTHQAKNKLNAYFKKENKEENIKRGKEILESTCKVKHIELKELLKEEWLTELYKKWTLKSLDDLFASVGYGSLTSTQVINKLLTKYINEQKINNEITVKNSKSNNVNKTIVFDNNLTGLMVRFAKCCSPVPGDDIIGFISLGRGVTIHSKDCPNVSNLSNDRIINAYFSDVKNKKFNAHISVLANKSNNIIINCTKLLAENKIELTGLNVVNVDKGVLTHIYINIKDVQELNSIINKLSSIKDVIEVKRTKGE